MRPTNVGVLALLLCLFAGTAQAASYVVPDDDVLIEQAEAIIVGRVASSEARPTRGIETWSAIEVEEVLKGEAAFAPGQTIELAEAGGIVGERALIVPGSPRYRKNDRVIAFLQRREDGQWVTLHMGLGKFRSEERGGRRKLLRGEEGEPIIGVTPDGREYVDPERDEERFRTYIRERSRGKRPYKDYEEHAKRIRKPVAELASLAMLPVLPQVMSAYPASSYSMLVSGRPARWRTWDTGGTISYRSNGTQRNQADSVGSAMRALAAWTNDTGSGIKLAYAGTTTATRGTVSDGINSIIFNDPANEVAGSWTGSGVVAVGRFWANLTAHTWKSESFYVITEGDVTVQDGVVLSSVKFDEGMVHELGHTLGFRHSNDAKVPSTTAAVMNSTLTGKYGINLQSWDRSAAAATYSTATTTPCTAPAITGQPRSTTVRSGTATTLVVTATGTGLKYQWYRGTTGVKTSPVSGATARTFTTPALSANTPYWVAVTGTCGTVNSSTAVVSVCSGAPSIATQPLSKTITRGTSTGLSVLASGVGPFTYEWYQGAVGDTTRRVSSSRGFTTPALTATTSYWVRVRNACGYVNSRAAVITVR
ncbi:MAG TPA: hypothetical protein VE974_26545 [Thermoanaerobaculia bacterium]|nr:hypothetical protein [Thermoanaerobaculia bacterium]